MCADGDGLAGGVGDTQQEMCGALSGGVLVERAALILLEVLTEAERET